MPKQWMYHKDGVECGPVTSAKLRQLARSGSLVADDRVRPINSSEWVRAEQVSGLIPDKAKNIGSLIEDESLPHHAQMSDRTQEIACSVEPQNKLARIMSHNAYLGFVVITLLIFCSPVGLFPHVNTAIGYPSIYWEQGFWTFFGFILVCLCLGISTKFIIQMTGHYSAGLLPVTVALLVTAAVVLQFLPSPQSGIQFLPILPWSYSGWLSFLVSVCVWCSLFMAVLFGAHYIPQERRPAGSFLLIVMFLNVMLSFSEHSPPPQPTIANQKPNVAQDFLSKPKGDKADGFRSQLRTWIQERQQLNDVATKLKDGRWELVQTMRSAGKDSPSARIYAEEILELDGQIKMLGTKVQTYEAAITKGESTLRRIERRKMLQDIGVSENELNEFAATVYELDDSLKKMTGGNVSLDLDVDDVMKEVFSASAKNQDRPSEPKRPQDNLKKRAKTDQTAGGQRARQLFNGETLDNWTPTAFEGRGRVHITNSSLILERGRDSTGVTWKGQALPRENYEISLEVKRLNGSDFFCGLTFPVKQQYCTLIVGGWGGEVVGLSSVDGLDAANNTTTSRRRFDTDRWYKVRLRVDSNTVTVWLDEKQVLKQKIAGHRFSLRPEIKIAKPFGLAAWKTGAAFRNVRLQSIR